MAKALRVLFVEDSAPDMEEILHVLHSNGFAVTAGRVETELEMRAALTSGVWDLIIADHFLPCFDSQAALRTLKSLELDIPLIIISGVVDDDTAVVAMQAGACDFFRKGRLSRLAAAVDRELSELGHRRERDRAVKNLLEAEQRFRLIVETALDYAIFMLDPTGQIVTWNIGAERMFGYTPDEVTGVPLAHLYPRDAAAAGLGADVALAIAGAQGRYEAEVLWARRDGSVFWVQGVMVSLRSGDGTVTGYSWISRDIDKIKRAEEALRTARSEVDEQHQVRMRIESQIARTNIERQNLKNLFEQTTAIIAITAGANHVIEYSNPAHMRLLGGDWTGRNVREAQPESVEFIWLLDEVFKTGQAAEFNGFAMQVKGEKRHFDFVFSARRNALGDIDGVMCLACDVTEQTRAREAAEASSASKSAFLANMSHEIRTPIGAILGFSTLLKEPRLPVEERDRYIDTILRNGQALTRIIDDILDLAKVEAGRLEIEEINFALFELMTEVVDLFRERARQKGIYLLLDIDEAVPNMICSDSTRIRQILFNIIGNAIKFTDSGGVRVQVKLQSEDANALRLAIDVKDTGRGLTDSQRARLFQPFTQADNTTTRQFGGTGLGLALAKRLCEALGGTISIASPSEQRGTVFTIVFTAARFDASRVPPQTPKISRLLDTEDMRLQNIRVLVVDDAPDNQVLVKRFLTRTGAVVDLASDGYEGVEKAMTGLHDIVLMDIQMPRMDGYQALLALRARGCATPVIALTAHALLEERVRTRSAGFAAHLTKPLDREELVDTVALLTKPATQVAL